MVNYKRTLSFPTDACVPVPMLAGRVGFGATSTVTTNQVQIRNRHKTKVKRRAFNCVEETYRSMDNASTIHFGELNEFHGHGMRAEEPAFTRCFRADPCTMDATVIQ